MKRLHGLKRLVFNTIEETTRLVEQTHRSVTDTQLRRLDVVAPVGEVARRLDNAHRLISGAVYASIHGVSRGVDAVTEVPFVLAGGSTDSHIQFDVVTPLRSDAVGSLPWIVDAAQSALNGFVGDYLHRNGNGLDLGMSLQHDGRTLRPDPGTLADRIPGATEKIAVFVHGLSCTEWCWSLFAEQLWGDPQMNYGAKLGADLGYTPLYVRYNSGRHISENGRLLASLLDQVVTAYPRPVEEIVLVGHSMGGLVARSAAHYGDTQAQPWTQHLRHVFCIGSPNLGAPLEQGANLVATVLGAFDTPGAQVPALLLNARSVGIKDLRFGYIVDEEWQDQDADALLDNNRQQVPFVDQVAYSFVASSVTRDPKHPMGRLIGDLLVRLPSAAGAHPEPAYRVPFHMGAVFGGLTHFHLANHPDVYEQIKLGCAGASSATEPRRAMSR